MRLSDFGPRRRRTVRGESELAPRIAVRDSKAPARATLVLPAEAFAPFLEALKSSPRGP
ncbi:DUF397 domain-containing protein [Streptomyces hirsutus]|uniref:DUF397 domain-containing protein n=1 Tax=Streptomyces hirsutus TaxID=35620 RepID=UPI00331D0856